MHKASKINRTTASPRSTRRTCVWIPPDLGGLTHEQWWDERIRDDYSFLLSNQTRNMLTLNVTLASLIALHESGNTNYQTGRLCLKHQVNIITI